MSKREEIRENLSISEHSRVSDDFLQKKMLILQKVIDFSAGLAYSWIMSESSIALNSEISVRGYEL